MPCRNRLARWGPPGLAVLLLLAGAEPRAAMAASLSPQEVQVLGKALGFVQLPPDGATTVAVVYASGNAGSRADAEQIAAEIGDGVRVGSIILKPQVIDVAALASIEPAVIVSAADANGDAVMRASRARHALCVTAELAAVQSGSCIMTIRSNPRVEIVLNAEAARAAGVVFPIAFHMMVREL
ncbi:MAG: hypothetical protein ABSC95_26430 [Acetobacteraceae bacterium]|jgi:hypothetical protein